MKEYSVTVKPDESFLVTMQPDMFKEEVLERHIEGKKAFFLIDSGIGSNAIANIARYVDERRIKAHLMAVEGGEQVKDGLEKVLEVVDAMQKFGMDRKEKVVLIGGGAVLDMGGFASSILHRGIEHIRIPTTYLAQVDAGIGVKNAINYAGSKNALGVFQPPQTVIVDPTFLYTLDERQMRSGLAESIKVALMKDAYLFELVEKYSQHVLSKDFSAESRAYEIMWDTIVAHLDQIKSDPYERKLARPLDFGHEWGHRLEIITEYRLNHGEAVSIGMAIDSYISFSRKYITETDLNRILNLMEAIGLPRYDHQATLGGIGPGLESFRRHLGGQLTISLLASIGTKVDVHEIDRKEVLEALDYLKDNYST
jgi:3-dehydroquinate synthase